MFVADLSELLSAEKDESVLNTDNLPVIEFSTPKSALHFTNFANAQVLLDHFTPIPPALLEGYSDEQVASIQAGHAGLRLVLEAAILKDAGKLGEAFAKLVQARELAPANPVITNEAVSTLLSSAGSMMDMGQLEQAAHQYQLALSYDPTNFWALHRYFTLCMMGGQQAEGLKWLDRAQATYPDAAAFWSLRATYATIQGAWPEALSFCEKAVNLGPWQPELWLQLAICADRVGAPQRAAEARAKADELAANSVALQKVGVQASPTAP
jgi:tetratricopeptide (TPR) repeat protein